MQTEHKQRESKMQAQLVALQRRLRGSERRATALQQDKSRAATVLQRKDQQLQDSKQALQSLQVRYYTPCTPHAHHHSFFPSCIQHLCSADWSFVWWFQHGSVRQFRMTEETLCPQASLEASEKRAAAGVHSSTVAEKGTGRHRSQDGSCVSTKSVSSDTSDNLAVQRMEWWDEQISLLAQRLSAGKRTEQLQERIADVGQQITSVLHSDSPGAYLLFFRMSVTLNWCFIYAFVWVVGCTLLPNITPDLSIKLLVTQLFLLLSWKPL